MATQTLHCKPGNHTWRRESQRGKPPAACPTHAKAKREVRTVVIQSDSSEPETVTESASAVVDGIAQCDRLMNMLASRGQLLSQQTGRTYSGPRY